MTEIKVIREDEKATAILKAIRQIDDGAELEPVVRCKDCKHCCLDLSGRGNHLCMRKEIGFVLKRKADDFCSYGERRDNGTSTSAE